MSLRNPSDYARFEDLSGVIPRPSLSRHFALCFLVPGIIILELQKQYANGLPEVWLNIRHELLHHLSTQRQEVSGV